MIFGIGIDIIEVARVEKQIAGDDSGFLKRIFSEKEIGYCELKRNRAQHYAARFAAKEAFFKAIGIGWRNGLAWSEIEILDDDLGKPNIFLHGKAKQFIDENHIKQLHVSLSHLKETAVAVVILEI
ncbi:MAG: holo-ACP synthase [Candidatus Zhuqueibacterota bacterium]